MHYWQNKSKHRRYKVKVPLTSILVYDFICCVVCSMLAMRWTRTWLKKPLSITLGFRILIKQNQHCPPSTYRRFKKLHACSPCWSFLAVWEDTLPFFLVFSPMIIYVFYYMLLHHCEVLCDALLCFGKKKFLYFFFFFLLYLHSNRRPWDVSEQHWHLERPYAQCIPCQLHFNLDSLIQTVKHIKAWKILLLKLRRTLP